MACAIGGQRKERVGKKKGKKTADERVPRRSERKGSRAYAAMSAGACRSGPCWWAVPRARSGAKAREQAVQSGLRREQRTEQAERGRKRKGAEWAAERASAQEEEAGSASRPKTRKGRKSRPGRFLGLG